MKALAFLAIIVGLSSGAEPAKSASDRAAKIEKELKNALPPELRDIVKIEAMGVRYRAHIDLSPAIKQLSGDLQFLRVAPSDIMFQQSADQTWNASVQKKDLSLPGDQFSALRPSRFNYAAKSRNVSAVYNASLGTVAVSLLIANLEYSMKNGSGEDTTKIESYNGAISTSHNANGKLQINGEVTTRGSHQTRKFPPIPYEFDIRSKSGHAVFSLKGIDVDGLIKIAFAVWQKDATINETLVKVITAFRDHPSPIEEFAASGTVIDPTAAFNGITLLAQNFGYNIKLAGAPQDCMAEVRLTAEHPSFQPGRFARGIEQAMPNSASFGLTLARLDPEAGILAFVRTARFQDTEKRTDAIGNAMLPHGIKIAIHDAYAQSPVYDVAVSGSINIFPLGRDSRGNIDMTITARSIDKTVKFLQDNAGSVPQFGQASFFILMAKGLAKQQSEGLSVWHVIIDGPDKVTINGQRLPGIFR